MANVFGSRRRGSSPSQPSRTFRSANSGRYFATASSRSSTPLSASCNAATVVTIFVIDAMRYSVSTVTGSGLPTALGPNAPS